jgi:hypothetical protein
LPTKKTNPLLRWGIKASLSGAAFFIGTSFAWAVDHYVLDIPAFVMAGDPDVSFSVTPLSDGVEDPSSHTVRFVDLPAGVSVEATGPSAQSSGPQTRFDVQGRQEFKLTVPESVIERRIWIKVQNNAKARVQGAGFVNVEWPVHRFSITPLGNSAPRAGVPYPFQIMAFDEAGAVVRSFRGPVSFGVARGQVSPAELAGDAFKNGTASVSVEFSDGNPYEATRFSVSARETYGAPSPAQGAVDAIVLPREGP